MSISVQIGRKALERAVACEEGMRLFEELRHAQGRKRSVYVRRYTVLHQLWLATAAPVFYGWLRDRGLIPVLSMMGANFRGAGLYGADLYGANLYGADLRGAGLSNADLRNADLRAANFRGADLYGANLYGADLRGADLSNANRWLDDAPIEGWRLRDGVLTRVS